MTERVELKRRINGRTKGLQAERDVANYLKAHGLTEARRSVVTGHATLADAGDIAGVPGFAIQVKNLARRLEGKLLADTWAETCTQATELGIQQRSGTVMRPVIIEKRVGSADVGRWWLHTDVGILVRMTTGVWRWSPSAAALVRIEVGDVIGDWVAWIREIERGGG
jgi:hypothetical protein